MSLLIEVKRFSEKQRVTKPNIEKVEGSTISKVVVTDTISMKPVFECYCLENAGPSTDESGKDRRVIAREYQLRWTRTKTNRSLQKFDSEWAVDKKKHLVKDGTTGPYIALHLVSEAHKFFEYRRILIHIGNYPQDTEGCLLFGYGKNVQRGTINDSARCIRDFFNLVEKHGVEGSKLIISEME